MKADTAWTALTRHVRDIETLERVAGLLGWDQQTMMPARGAPSRGEELALVSRLTHERVADPRIGDWLDVLEAAELEPVQAAAVRNLRRSYDRAVKVPSELVERMARAQTAGFEAWVGAREASDFARFSPHLVELLALAREQVAAIDDARHPYDVLLDVYDPGVTVDALRHTFTRLRSGLAELLDAVRGQPQLPTVSQRFPLEQERLVHAEVAAALGYDLDAGRMDESEHPFTMGLAPGDVRITTRFVEGDFVESLGSTVHEVGHALYEQGLPEGLLGTTVGSAPSFGLHESQSRFWENFVARSEPFAEWLVGLLHEHIGGDVPDAATLYAASNRVEPGLIRVAADEVTYNLHIIVRFELELALFEGTLDVAELPEAWNARYREFLGIEPPDDARGVLQDVHWSGGSFGYFPSYTLGNLYGASLARQLESELPDLWDGVRAGEFGPILGWLRDRIHRHGHLEDAPDLVRDVVGDRDHVADLLDHLWGRHGALYGVSRPR